MDFLYNGEPGGISAVRAAAWRIQAEKSAERLTCQLWKDGCWQDGAEVRAEPGTLAQIRFVVPEKWNVSGNMLMLFLPFQAANKAFDELFELPEKARARWSWPVLEARLPIAEIRLKNFPLPAQPQTIFFDGWLRTAEERFYELPEMPLTFADTPAETLQVYAGGNLADGVVRIGVTAEQSAAARFMADRNADGMVTLEYDRARTVCRLRGGNAVCKLPLNSDKPFTVKAFYPGLPVGESNLTDPSFLRGCDYRIVWGDIHVHSRESDGTGEPGEIVVRARDWRRLDFMAFNEHIEHSLSWRRWDKAKWEKLRGIYDANTVDGEFVIIPGFEYYSYCNLWCFSEEYHTCLAPEFTRGTEEYRIRRADTPEGKRQQEEVQRKIAEIAAKPDWLVGYHRLELLKDQLGRLPTPVQLLQMAHYKRPPEVGSMDYLLRGDRVAFFGSTDTHLGMPGVGFQGPREAQSGLTAVYVADLSRQGLHEALRSRRTYATMGSRTLLDVRLDGAMAGSEIAVPDGRTVTVTARAAGCERLKSVDLVADGENRVTLELGGKTFMEKSFRIVRAGSAPGFCFIRLHLEDGRMVWSSPFYLT